MIVTKPRQRKTYTWEQLQGRRPKTIELSREEKIQIFNDIRANCDLVYDCWVWKGSLDDDGYGRKRIKGKLHTTSRIMLAFYNGDALNHQGAACHKPECLDKACCNPQHLFWGSYRKNCLQREEEKRQFQALPDDQKYAVALVLTLRRLGIVVHADQYQKGEQSYTAISDPESTPKPVTPFVSSVMYTKRNERQSIPILPITALYSLALPHYGTLPDCSEDIR